MLGRKYQLLVFGDLGSTPNDLFPLGQDFSDPPVLSAAEQLPEPISGIDSLMIITSETYALISAEESQTIYITIYDESIAIENVIPYIEIYYPDDTSVVYLLMPTNSDGQTSIHFPPINGKNGSLVEYKVCLNLEDEEPHCVLENFLIWNP
jgi:hypothetical protein